MKLFIGGLSYDTTDATLREYFSQFGRVVAAVVMREQSSGQSRGFGFVAFADAAGGNAVLERRDHLIDGRWVEAKAAVPRGPGQNRVGPGAARSPARPAAATDRNADSPPPRGEEGEEEPDCAQPQSLSGQHRKIFVGGLHGDTGDASLSAYFSVFGQVDGAQVLYNRNTGRSRGFGFVTFGDAEALAAALASRMHIIDGKLVEVKPAVPKTTRGATSPARSEGEAARASRGHTSTPPSAHRAGQRSTPLVASAKPFQPRGRASSRCAPGAEGHAAGSVVTGARPAEGGQGSTPPGSASEGSAGGRMRNGSFGSQSRGTGLSDASPRARLTPTPPLEAPPRRDRASTGLSWASAESGAEWPGRGGGVEAYPGDGAALGRVASDETRWRQLGRAAATGNGDVSHLLAGVGSRGEGRALGATLWDATAADRSALQSLPGGGVEGGEPALAAAAPTVPGVWRGAEGRVRGEGEEVEEEEGTASHGGEAVVDSLRALSAELATAVPELGTGFYDAGGGGGGGGDGGVWRQGLEGTVWGVSAGVQS